jgi:hypothetical protein
MSNIHRLRVALTGFPGAPGVATFYALSGSDLVAPLHDLWLSLAQFMPADVAIDVQATGDVIEDTTGELVGTWSGTGEAIIPGVATGVYAAPVGVCLTWITAAIVDSHHLKGRTFVVPTVGIMFDTDGTVSTENLSYLRTAVNDFVAATGGNQVVWHRPRAAKPADGSRPAITARVGGHSAVTDAAVKDMAVVLRSRRD